MCALLAAGKKFVAGTVDPVDHLLCLGYIVVFAAWVEQRKSDLCCKNLFEGGPCFVWIPKMGIRFGKYHGKAEESLLLPLLCLGGEGVKCKVPEIELWEDHVVGLSCAAGHIQGFSIDLHRPDCFLMFDTELLSGRIQRDVVRLGCIFRIVQILEEMRTDKIKRKASPAGVKAGERPALIEHIESVSCILHTTC